MNACSKVLLASFFGGVGLAHAECLPVQSLRCIFDLGGEGAPRASPACGSDAWRPHLAFEQPDRFADRNGDGSWETVVRLELDPKQGCRCAVLRVYWSEKLHQFAVDIGDSPTNDGYGGDAGSSAYSAEVHTLGDRLFVFSTGVDHQRDELLHLELPAATRILEVEVCDQFVAFTAATGPDDPRPLKAQMSTATVGRLFHFGAAGAPGPGTGDYTIYASFNRVIHRRDGAPVKDRFGSGVERVELFLSP
jgi:hypothetical protein